MTEVGPGHVTLGDGTTILTRCVIWGGGNMAPPLAGEVGATQGRGGRIEVLPDLTVEGLPGVYAIGDIANIPVRDGTLPQLGSVAMQSGVWAAENLLADADGRPRTPFHYRDKGIMAMIGRGAAIAAGPYRRELRGLPAFAAWLGVHAALLTGARNRVETFLEWGVRLLLAQPRAADPRPQDGRHDRLVRRHRAGDGDHPCPDGPVTEPPAHLLVYAFPSGATFEGGLVGALERLESGGALRILGALFVQRDADSEEIAAIDLRGRGAGSAVAPLLGFRLDPAERRKATKRALADDSGGLPGATVRELAQTLAPGAAVAAVLVEHVWASRARRRRAAVGRRRA